MSILSSKILGNKQKININIGNTVFMGKVTS